MGSLKVGDEVIFYYMFGGIRSGIVRRINPAICEVNENGRVYIIATSSIIGKTEESAIFASPIMHETCK